MICVANMRKGKLTPNFSGDKHVILKQKGSDTFELVQVETGKRVIRNVKFLRKAPANIDMSLRQYDDGPWLDKQEPASQRDNPTGEGNANPMMEEESLISYDEPAEQETGELRRSARQPKPKRDIDYLYY